MKQVNIDINSNASIMPTKKTEREIEDEDNANCKM